MGRDSNRTAKRQRRRDGSAIGALAIAFLLVSSIGAARAEAPAPRFSPSPVAEDAFSRTPHIAGSSTVLPYAQLAAQGLDRLRPEIEPILQGGGSGDGLRRLCGGVGEDTIDVANASRPIKDEERARCAEQGATPLEFKFGYDGIVFAYDVSAAAMDLSPRDIYRLVAKERVIGGRVVANPTRKLTEVNRRLTDFRISFYVPADNHGTRDVFERKVLQRGCVDDGAFDFFVSDAAAEGADSAKAKKTARDRCRALRQDGAVIEVADDYRRTLKYISSNREGIGVFGLAFFEAHRDRLQVAKISGQTPMAQSIVSGLYPISRPLFIYAKKEHLTRVRGLSAYLEFFLSDHAIGPGSALADHGLVPAPQADREAMRARLQKALEAPL